MAKKKNKGFAKTKKWSPDTKMIHGGTLRSQYGETAEALFLTSGYVYSSAEEAAARFTGESEGYIYGRYGNPTVTMLEERIRLLEGSEAAMATASGMAAVTASLLCQLQTGDHVVAAKALFGSCRYVIETLLPRFGIEVTLVDGQDLEQWQEAVQHNSKVFFLESPTNPTLELVDIEAVSKIAHKANARLVVDNVFATPILQKPLELGADIVAYSTTKHIDGQGRCLGGMVLGSKKFIEDELENFIRQTGPSMSPFNAWIMLKGLETLDMRVKKSCKSARKIAKLLGKDSRINKVIYPGHKDFAQNDLYKKQMKAGSTLVAFELAGTQKQTFKFMNALKIIKICNNLGDTKSLITHPATTTHFRLTAEARAETGIGETLVRLSVGLENAGDLKDDLTQALEQSGI